MCLATSDPSSYKKYGKSNKCKNGMGGPWANSVYELREYQASKEPIKETGM